MDSIESKLARLKGHLESVAFLVSRGSSEQEAHSKIVQSLVLLAEIENQLIKPIEPEVHDRSAIPEINKVNRRLKLWAKRQDQINSKILNAFLKLERSGATPVREIDLRNELPDEKSFESNFVQMKIIAERNHGKIFEQYGENISLWSPVIDAVREYENVVFESK